MFFASLHTKMFRSVIVFIVILISFQNLNAVTMNNRPIIGILAGKVHSKFAPNATSVIWASYVKFVEMGGARVVPILIHQSKQYYEDLLSQINGVLFPGGGSLLDGDGYGRSGKIIFDIATKMNENGNYFPLWGTCLGFELLNFLVAKKLWMKACSAEDLPANLNFVRGFNNSRMFKKVDETLKYVMETKPVTVNYHQWCLTPLNYSISGLDKYFKVLAVNKDSKNVTFISAIEAHKYPFYGVAFHPEKIIFEWIQTQNKRNIPHSLEAIQVSQYFANFFINEARKNFNTFPSREVEDNYLIYNYNPIFTGKYNNSIEQKYYFS